MFGKTLTSWKTTEASQQSGVWTNWVLKQTETIPAWEIRFCNARICLYVVVWTKVQGKDHNKAFQHSTFGNYLLILKQISLCLGFVAAVLVACCHPPTCNYPPRPRAKKTMILAGSSGWHHWIMHPGEDDDNNGNKEDHKTMLKLPWSMKLLNIASINRCERRGGFTNVLLFVGVNIATTGCLLFWWKSQKPGLDSFLHCLWFGRHHGALVWGDGPNGREPRHGTRQIHWLIESSHWPNYQWVPRRSSISTWHMFLFFGGEGGVTYLHNNASLVLHENFS